MALSIAKTTLHDVPEILSLYKLVAEDSAGLIRKPAEVNEQYVYSFVEKSISNGLSLIAKDGNKIVGEIHAITPDIFAFQHLLTDLTIAVHPARQGQGIGKALFLQFLEEVKNNYRHIRRIELFVREQNSRNIRFYESLGFVNEGRQQEKIFINETSFETPLHMAKFC